MYTKTYIIDYSKNHMKILFQELLSYINHLKANEITTKKLTKINFKTDFFSLLPIIVNADISILNVVDDNDKHKGFITLMDILKMFEPKHSDIHAILSRKHALSTVSAQDLAITHFPSIYDNTELGEIAELMLKYETDFLPRAPNKKDSNCVGVILLKDIISEVIDIQKKFTVENGE
jgi:predicted transcriptional regulator